MKYTVQIPIAGYIETEVDAQTEEEAIEKAFNSDLTLDQVTEWDAFTHITEGHTIHIALNDITAWISEEVS